MAISWIGLGPWFNAKVVDPLLQMIRKGAEPKQLAFSTALGVTLGVFPICVPVQPPNEAPFGATLFLGDDVMQVENNQPYYKRERKDKQIHLVAALAAVACYKRGKRIQERVTVFLCGMAIAVLGSLCHPPSMMLANFIATPLELSLLVPFLRFGEALTGGAHFPLTADALKKVLTCQASWEVLLSIVHALLGWVVAAPFVLAALYMLFLPCFKVLLRKFSSGSLSPKKPLLSSSDICLKVREV
ncbi:hypothetical protein RJ641_029904 [Dillenia turbinata]|uniref:Uncharacterized protein n=1 Tax=Dillenia turbinata TaxID=194707 RepID=A0AAN8VSN0_9MAGN